MAKGNLVKFTAFRDEDEAIAMLERMRWPNGATCPHCGGADPYRLTSRTPSKRPARKGLWKCRACRKQFTVKVGTIFEQSHIPVSTWLSALHLHCASKKGMSAHQFHRMLGISYRAAWFMAHRLRHAMASGRNLRRRQAPCWRRDPAMMPFSGTVGQHQWQAVCRPSATAGRREDARRGAGGAEGPRGLLPG